MPGAPLPLMPDAQAWLANIWIDPPQKESE
jgi:hypothetical protein